MASLFHTRQLSHAYPNRNVVNQSIGTRNVNDVITFKVLVDFGVNGKLERRLAFRPVGRPIGDVMAELKLYKIEINTIIDTLKELHTWVNKPARLLEHLDDGPRPAFTKIIFPDERPLMFHAARRRNKMVFQIFGEGILGYEVTQDYKDEQADRAFNAKILDMINTFAAHLDDINTVPFYDFAEGAVK